MQGYNRGSYRGANTRLPVDPQQVDTRNYVQQTPAIRRVDLGQLNSYTQNLIDALVIQIQDNAERSALRTFAFNYWGDRQFTGPQFLELLQAYAAHVETICILNNANPVEVIEGEAEFFMTAASASLVETFPEITEFLPPEAEDAIVAAQRDWHGIVRDIKAAQRQMGNQPRASYGGGQGGGAYGRQPAHGGFNRMAGGGGGGRYGNEEPRLANLRPSWEVEASPAPRYQDTAGPRPGFSSIQPATATPTTSGTVERVEVNKVNAPVATRSSGYGARVREPNPRPFDKVVASTGEVLIPAFLSGLTADYTTGVLPLVHDRNTHMLFHVVHPDGRVTETIQEKTPEMEYLEHELDEKLKKVYRANLSVFAKERAEPVIQLARKLVPNKDGHLATTVSEETRHALDAAKAPRQLTMPFRAESLAKALFQAQLEAARLPDESEFLEFQVEEVVSQAGLEGMLPHLLTLRRCETYTAFRAAMHELHKTDKIDERVFDMIDRRMTVAFNRYNSKRLYLGLVVDSFMGDYQDILNDVSQRGEAVLAKFVGGAKAVIQQACAVLTGDSLTTYLKELGPEGAVYARKEPACFVNRYSVTQLPWSLYEMGHHWRLEGVVTPENAKPFYDALQAIFSRTQTNGVREHVLLTSDKRQIYAYKSPIIENNFVITTEPPLTDTSFLEKAIR